MDYVKLSSLEETSATLQQNSNAKIIAGGTDLLVHYRHKRIEPDLVIDIKCIDVLRGIKIEDGFLKIGTCTILNDIAENQLINEKFNVLTQAASWIGCYQIRNRATIGGNLCNASPAADMIPPLYAMEATMTYFQDGDMHTVPVHEFFVGPGKTVMKHNAILCHVNIPVKYENAKGIFVRHSRRNSLDLSTVSVCVVNKDNRFTMSLGSVAPTVVRVPEAENLLNNEGLNDNTIERVAELAQNSCCPISDLRGSKEYRMEMVNTYTKKALKSLLEV